MMLETESKSSEMLCFKAKGERIFLHKDEVLMFVTNKRKIDLYTAKNIVSLSGSLGDFEKKLARMGFYRTHQSYLVNLSAVRKVIMDKDKYYIQLKGADFRALLSRSNKNDFYEKMIIV